MSGVGQISYDWDESQYLNLPDSIQKARMCLEDWYNAINDESVKTRMPDIFFEPHVTQEMADKVVESLDAGFESNLSWAKTTGYEASPGFCRLKPQQRIRLAQDLYLILHKEDRK